MASFLTASLNAVSCDPKQLASQGQQGDFCLRQLNPRRAPSQCHPAPAGPVGCIDMQKSLAASSHSAFLSHDLNDLKGFLGFP